MTDNDFQQTKRVLLGQESMNKEYAQLADFIQERFSVQVINVICAKGEDSINLTLWFKYEIITEDQQQQVLYQLHFLHI